MINSLQQWPFWRDVWGNYDAAVIPRLAPLDHNSCYRPKFYNAPDVSLQRIAAGDSIRYTLTVSPGSLIYGFSSPMPDALFAFQMTDIATGHEFWDQPVSNIFLSNQNGLVDSNFQLASYPTLLCAPYPVVGEGRFKVEMWANKPNREPVRCAVIVWVAEVWKC